jgi:hypothetical protein
MPFLPNRLDREAGIRIRERAEALKRRTEPGKAYGPLTSKHLDVLDALLGLAGSNVPSAETIAAKAHCSRSTVFVALKAVGILAVERSGTTIPTSVITWEG